MKEYAVSVDIVMAGTVYVKAESEEDAKAIAYGKTGYYDVSDLRRHHFINVTREVVDVEEAEEQWE